MAMKYGLLLTAGLLLMSVLACGSTGGRPKVTNAPYGTGYEIDWWIVKSPVTGNCYEMTEDTTAHRVGIAQVDCSHFDNYVKTFK